MDLTTWRKQQREGVEFETPSGLVVRLRRVSLLDMAALGEIPTPLVAAVDAVFDSRSRDLTVEMAGQFTEVVDLLVRAAMVDPPVADRADEGHLAVSELPMKDRVAIYNWCQMHEPLRPFRGAGGEPADPGRGGAAVRSATVGDPGD